MYVIGITGGVGSGKSYAAHRLQEKLGATLLIADELGHVVMEPGRSAYCQIVEHIVYVLYYFRTSTARFIRATVSSLPNTQEMSNMCGPLPSPTRVRRKAFMILPV